MARIAAWLLDPKTIVALDWVGSLLMIGTVWGWLYERLDVPLLRYENRYRHRREAYRRLWLRRGGGRAMEASLEHWARQGIHLRGLPLTEQLRLTAEAFREQKRLLTKGKATPEQIAEWNSLRPPTALVKHLGLTLMPGSLLSDASWMSLAALRSLTESVFTGTMAKVLFVVGFVLWNASKAASCASIP